MDIPEGAVLNEEELTNALEAAQRRGVKVLLRAEEPAFINLNKLQKESMLYEWRFSFLWYGYSCNGCRSKSG
jgi:hypothetical protein